MNIQSGRIKTKQRNSRGSVSIGAKLVTAVKVVLVVLTGGSVLNGYIYLNQKISETERSILRTTNQISETEREIDQQRVQRERLTAWPHIKVMIERFDLKLKDPTPGQVVRINVLSPSAAANIELSSLAAEKNVMDGNRENARN